MFETMQPLYDKVLVKLLKADEKTTGGIYIPEEAQSAQRYQKGLVIAVGEGKCTNDGFTLNPKVNAGDVVIFGKFAGMELDDDYRMLNESDIYGIVKNQE